MSQTTKQSKLYLFNWVFSVISISLLDVLLLEIKYQSFSGGFLQSHQILGYKQIAYFLVFLLTMNMFFYGVITLLMYIFAKKFRVSNLSANYHLFWVMFFGSILIISVKYQLHTYFGDFLTFAIVKNLGGGSAFDAFVYVIHEGIAAVGVIFLSIAVWLVGARIIMKFNRQCSTTVAVKIPYLILTGCLAGLLITSSLSYANRDIRYHLNRTTAYSSINFLYSQIGESNERKYPLDIPDNNIDEDGLDGDFHFSPAKEIEYTFGTVKRHIVLIVLESVRQDVLDEQVNGIPVTPILNGIASTGTRIDNYFSHTGYTTSSLAAIFTMGPGTEGDPPRLLKALKKNEYNISVISGQDESFGDISKNTGTKKYSDFYFDASYAPEKRMFSSASPGSLAIPNSEVVAEFKLRTSVTDWSRPQFFYLNFQAAHFPYFHDGMAKLVTNNPILRKNISPKNRKQIRETYLNAVAVDDQSIGMIVRELKRLKIYENTLLLIVGDHGESLFDDGLLGHGMRISKTQLNTIFVSNQVINKNGVFGHSDLGRILLENSGGVGTPESTAANEEVFHFIGPIENPTFIGLTQKNNTRLIIDLSESSYQIEEKNGKISIFTEAQLKSKIELNNQFNHLIELWETQRWQRWLNAKPI
jgi:phosphoglycerol transferase MdoB-like AlkP superfamily enzyme